MTWQKVVPFSRLNREKIHVLKKAELFGSIAVILNGEKIYAFDNRCPHQGYPLEDGLIDEERGTLTCNKHFWEFDLKSGQCLKAGARIRVYETKVEADYVWIEL